MNIGITGAEGMMLSALTAGAVAYRNALKQTKTLTAAVNEQKDKIVELKTAKENLDKDLEAARLEALEDGLTKLGTRRHWELKLNTAVRNSIRTGEPFAVLATDIDNFKRVNDTYGHQAGDAVLRETAKLIKDSVRDDGVDFVGRVGGEEIAILLPNTGLLGARKVAERIIRNMHAGEDFGAAGKQTLSIGISVFPNDTAYKEGTLGHDRKEDSAAARNFAAEVYTNADIALYTAKNKGKDQYRIYSQTVEGAKENVQAAEAQPVEPGSTLYGDAPLRRRKSDNKTNPGTRGFSVLAAMAVAAVIGPTALAGIASHLDHGLMAAAAATMGAVFLLKRGKAKNKERFSVYSDNLESTAGWQYLARNSAKFPNLLVEPQADGSAILSILPEGSAVHFNNLRAQETISWLRVLGFAQNPLDNTFHLPAPKAFNDLLQQHGFMRLAFIARDTDYDPLSQAEFWRLLRQGYYPLAQGHDFVWHAKNVSEQNRLIAKPWIDFADKLIAARDKGIFPRSILPYVERTLSVLDTKVNHGLFTVGHWRPSDIFDTVFEYKPFEGLSNNDKIFFS
ncbi:MAG: GGDEF domain-containing protein, partial [Elusimicrobiota bacterium]